MTTYGKFPATLPFGVTRDNQLIRDFTVREVDNVFEDIYTHQAFATKHPQQWTARVTAAILQSIGDIDIRSEFRKQDLQKIPEIVRDLTVQDVSYILMCGHINTYGTQVDSVEQRCQQCNRVSEFKCDLNDVTLPEHETPNPNIHIYLPKGLTVKDLSISKPGMPFSFDGATLNYVEMTMPTIKHAIQNERYYSIQKLADFNIRLAQSAITNIGVAHPTEDDPTPEPTSLIPQEELHLIRNNFFVSMKGLDRQALRKTVKDKDVTRLEIEQECPCGYDMSVAVNVGDLYPFA